MEFRKDINGLRAVAVLLVLLFHFGTPGFDAGFIGVDVFFVISGFLMTRIIVSGLEKHSFSILRFYQARLARLYPALLALVAATLIFGLVFIEPAVLESIARDGISALLFFSNFVFWKEAGYFGAPAASMWMLHTWSLSVEWQFYLLYPLVLAVSFPLLRGRTACFVLLLAGFVLSLVLSVVLGTFFPNDRLVSAGFYMLPPRAWELLAGGLVALWPWRAASRTIRAAGILEIAGITMVLSSLLLLSRDTPWPSYAALLPVAGTMLVLAANAPRSVLAATPFQSIGAWSYSIYLWHWPMVAASAYFGMSGWMTTVILFALSLLAGYVSYTFIEQPCRTLLKGTPGARGYTHARPMARLVCAPLAVIAAAAATMVYHGIPQRNEAVAAIYRPSLAAEADNRFPYKCDGTGTFGTTVRQCVLGSASNHDDVLVIGDSFAQMWYAHITELEPKLFDHAVVFITKGGCPPIAGLERRAPGFGCSSFHEKEMMHARSDRYRTVILVGMWTSYFVKDPANSVICNKNGRCVPAGTSAGLTAARDNLTRDIDELRALGKTVVVLTTSPYPGFHVPEELRKRVFAGNTPPLDWTFDFSAVVDRSQPIDAGLEMLAGHGATVIDIAHLLCRDMICPATRDGVLLYRDHAHMRSSYTASAGNFLDRFIEQQTPTAGVSVGMMNFGPIRP
ncbi:MAG: acyltransferase family protein [Rhizobiaceae bacterium]